LKRETIVSLIILNYNGREHLEACLASVGDLTFPKENLETIIVDNASTDNSVAFIKSRFPDVVLIENAVDLGFSKAANLGAMGATGKYLAFLNNDMRVDKNWLSVLVDTARAGKGFACVGSTILNRDGSALDFAGRPDDAFCLAYKPFNSSLALPGSSPYSTTLFVSGGAALILRTAFQTLGGFDPDFFLYHEDVDLGWRLWLRGYECALSTESIVYHRGGTTASRLAPEFIQTLSQKHTLFSIFKNLEEKNLREALPLLLFFFLERGRWVSAAQLSLATAIHDFQSSLNSLIAKRKEVQTTRVRTDADLFAEVGHPCNLLLRQIYNEPIRQTLMDSCSDIGFDPDDVDSTRTAIYEWVNRGHLLYESRLTEELAHALFLKAQHLSVQGEEAEKNIRERDEAIARLVREVLEFQQTTERLQRKEFEHQQTSERLKRDVNEKYQTQSDLHPAAVFEAQQKAMDQTNEYQLAAEQLQSELYEYEKKVEGFQRQIVEYAHELERLKAANKSLKEDRERNERQIQVLSSHLDHKDNELKKITNSIGWRLLSRYGWVKYRYLLPIYRLLGLAPYGKRSAPGLTEERRVIQEPTAGPEVEIPDEPRVVSRADLNDIQEVCESNAYDVICFPIIGWDFRFQRPQQLMSRFAAAGHRIFYMAPEFYSRGPAFTIQEKGKNIYEVSLRGPARNLYTDALDDKSRDVLLGSLDAMRRDLMLGASVAFVQLPFWWPLAEKARSDFAWPIVYDCMDHHAGFSSNKPTMVGQERDLLASADLVVVSSDYLERHALEHSSNVLLVRNACDYEHFAGAIKQRGDRPLIGYYGAIADWFDSDLVADVAKRRPDWDFVLVGSTFSADTSRLSKLPNVSLPGEKHYSEIPDWLRTFDVVLIPFKRNALTEATNPVKGYEILASGKPLISVPIPEMVALVPLVRLASNAEEFEREIEAALNENDPDIIEKRRDFARQHTWEKRYEMLAPAVREVFPQISIIIVTFNNLTLNRLCLESLYARTEWPNFEVIVLDNASSDGTREYLKEAEMMFPNLRVILNDDNLGFARANNMGLREAKGAYLVLLNNDTVVTRAWLSTLTRHLHADSEIGLIGPVTNEIGNEAKVPVGYTRLDDMPVWAANYVRENDNRLFAIPMLAMFCVALSRKVFERVGFLDEAFETGMFEDDDYTRRMRENGYKVVCADDCFIHHFGRASFKLLSDQEYIQIFQKNRKVYEEKWGSWEPHKARGAKQS
jgi:GT2 family glycosyltransferase/glycosyltransferase involved in cell wall biosynthesis